MQQKAIEVQAPNPVTIDQDYLNIFLAGSIEMGKAIEWQKEFIGEPVEGEPNSFRGGVVFAD